MDKECSLYEVWHVYHTTTQASDMNFIPSFFCLYWGSFFIICFHVCSYFEFTIKSLDLGTKSKRNKRPYWFSLKRVERNSQFFDKHKKSRQVWNADISTEIFMWTLSFPNGALKSYNSIIIKSILEKMKVLSFYCFKDPPAKHFSFHYKLS
jgi:hypothetical protein